MLFLCTTHFLKKVGQDLRDKNKFLGKKTLCHDVGHGRPQRGIISNQACVLKGHHGVAMVSHDVAVGAVQAHKVLVFLSYLSP